MIIVFRQNLIHSCSRNRSSSLFKSRHVFFPRSLLHFSTSGEGHSTFHPTVYQFLVHNHHFSHESASEVASVVPRLRNPERCDSIFSFFKENGFSNSQLERTAKCWPKLLSADLEKTIKPKFELFQDSGVSATDVTQIISNYPWILSCSVKNRLIPSLSVLKTLLGADVLVKHLKVAGWFLRADLQSSFIPNVGFLMNCGVSTDEIIRMMSHHPRLMLRKPEDLKKSVARTDAMGVSRGSKKFIKAVKVCGMSDENWELKLRTLREMGLSDVDIRSAFKKSPFVFGLSVETWKHKISGLREVGFAADDITSTFRNAPGVFHLTEDRIRKVKEVLLAVGKYDISCIVHCPRSLLFSIEKRFKPRLQVLELLDRKNLIQNWPALSTLSDMTDKRFHNKFVAPYLDEIGDVYLAKSDK